MAMPKFHDLYPIVNRAKGKLPVATVWDTDPTALANATDGDFDTVTGTGSKVVVGAAELGRITIDLGAVYNVHLRGKFGMWSTAGNVSFVIFYSDDDVTYRYTTWLVPSTAIAQVAEYILFNQIEFARARYIRVTFLSNVAMTGYVKIYEVQAIDLGI